MIAERANGKFRTSDMVLATLLSMEGNECTLERAVVTKGDGAPDVQCVWVFVEGDEFEDILEEFLAGDYRVEPREFAREWADVRRSMFSFLNRSNG
jgi:hypothetical protein